MSLFKTEMKVDRIQEQYALTNYVCFNPTDVKSQYIRVNGWIFNTYSDVTLMTGVCGLSGIHRRLMRLALGAEVVCGIYTPEKLIITNITCSVDFQSTHRLTTSFGVNDLQKEIIHTLNGQYLTIGQLFAIKSSQTILLISVVKMEVIDMTTGQIYDQYGLVTEKSVIDITKKSGTVLQLVGSGGTRQSVLKTQTLDPVELGIGGLNKEFVKILRRALVSRITPPDVIKGMGITHVKGVLLYGPPGTGKTLMARTIARMLNCPEPKIIAGPEMFNKFVGETESNIRNLFADAERAYKEQGDDSPLHIIVIDEIDALCSKRGSHTGGGNVTDSAVNQLLAKIDGVEGLNNLLIIGMTNRKDMIDEAVLRPGRLEIHIEVGLPDEEGRAQIFKIHTRDMTASGYLGSDINLQDLAQRTQNYTGAEIAGIVKNASSYALTECYNLQTLKGISDPHKIKVTRDHFEHALSETVPAYGYDEAGLETYLPNSDEYLILNAEHQALLNKIESYFTQFNDIHKLSVLLTGEFGSGTTTTAIKMLIDRKSQFPFIDVISPADLVGYSEAQKCEKIITVFEKAEHSSKSCLIIDSIEEIIEYVAIGPRFSNSILQTLKVMIQKKPRNCRMIIGTTNHSDVLNDLEIYQKFDYALDMPLIAGRTDVTRLIHSLNGNPDCIIPTKELTIGQLRHLIDRP